MKHDRWMKAQAVEKEFWQSHKDKLNHQEYDYYAKMIRRFMRFKKGSRALDIGSGPHSFIENLGLGKNRMTAIDPLMDYFLRAFGKSMNGKVLWLKGKGENLPFEDSCFDLVGIVNTLDHMDSPDECLKEANRVLKLGGILFLAQNCYSFPLMVFNELMEGIGLGDDCHPHFFSPDDLRSMLAENGFELAGEMENEGNYPHAHEPMAARIKRALDKGCMHVFKQGIIKTMHYIPDSIFSNYPLRIFIARKKKASKAGGSYGYEIPFYMPSD